MFDVIREEALSPSAMEESHVTCLILPRGGSDVQQSKAQGWGRDLSYANNIFMLDSSVKMAIKIVITVLWEKLKEI